MWCHLPTIFNHRRVLRYAVLASLLVAFITTLLFAHNSQAAPGINRTINFQGRLLTASGAVVPDGYYNIQFKIYQDGTGTAEDNPGGTLLWTETRINNGTQSGVQLKNGYLSVNLGSVTPFGSSVDWNQDTLWLSMNVAGNDLTCDNWDDPECAADGEMIPMKRMTASPYALNSGAREGKTADNFVQLAQGVQEDASAVPSIYLNKTGSGNLIQLQNTGVDIFSIDETGDLTFGSNADKTISIANAAASTDGSALTVSAGNGGAGTGNAGGDLVLQGGNGGGTNGNAGNVSIDTGVATGTGTAGTLSIGNANAGQVEIASANTATIQIGNDNHTGTQTINIGNNTNAGGQTNVTIGSTQGTSTTTINSGSGNVIVNGNTDSTGYVDAATGFKFNGTDGSTTTCNAGEYLDSQVVQGGIITGGSCSVLDADVTLQDAYDSSGNNPQITLGSTGGGLRITDNSTPISGNLFVVESDGGATEYLAVTTAGVAIDGDLDVTGTVSYTDSGVATTTAVCKDSNGALNACSTTGNGAAFVQGGNNFGANAQLGTTGAGQTLSFMTAGADRATLAADGSALTFLQSTAINTNGALALSLDTGGAAALNLGTTNANAINVGTASTATINIGNAALSSGTQAINIGTNNTAGGTTNVTIGTSSTATGGTTTIQSKSTTSIRTNNVARATFDTSGNLYLGNGTTSTGTGTFTLQGTGGGTNNIAGYALTMRGGTGGSGGTGNVGGVLTLQGGNGAGTNGGGGGVTLDAGTITGTGTRGTVALGTTNAGAVSIGNTNSAVTIQGNGTASAVSVQAAASGTISVGTANANNTTVTIGNTANAVAQTINVGYNNTASSTTNVNLGNLLSTSATLIQGGTGATAVAIQSGTSGTIGIATANRANTVQIGSTTLSSGTQTIVLGGANTAGGTQNVTVGSGGSAAGGTTTIQSKGDTTFATNGTTRATFSGSGNTLYVGNANGSGVHATPNAFTIQGTSNSGTGAGGALAVQAGNSGASSNGANLTLSGGTGGNGVNGLVVLTTPTFQTANTGTAYACSVGPCNVPQASVDNNAVIVVEAQTTSLTLNLPGPSISGSGAYGRILYITGDYDSENFTLAINGGGSVSNLISMRANASATLVWGPGNGGAGAWTAAGASSSTTLQAAYDNTIQSSGGAELIVSKTSNTNGLTIRDNSANPVDGALLSVQSKTAANLFSVNSNVVDYASNPGAEQFNGTDTSAFPSNTWSAAPGGGTIARNTNTANDTVATGQGSVSVTASAANSGVKNQIVNPSLSTPTPVTLTANNHYNVSFSVRLPAGASTFNDLKVDYSRDGTTGSLVPCTSDEVVTINVWKKINCSFTAPASGITTSNAIFIRQNGAGSRVFYVDNLSLTIAADYSLATDGGVDNIGSFGTNWPALPGTSVAHSTSVGNDASSSAQITANASGEGIKNVLAIYPNVSTLYRVTAYVATGAAFNTSNFRIQYSYNDSATTTCEDYAFTNDGVATSTISTNTSQFTKVTCYINTPANAVTNPRIYFAQTDATARTWYVDTFSMTLATSTTPNVQIGGGTKGGPTTLFTLDRGASAPIAGDNEDLLGSMYYDTTLGKLQCYEADGWGACGSSPDNIVTISPEYTNAVMHGTGVGTMTSDFCSDALNINDGSGAEPTICSTDETRNFYKWTSPQFTAQTYSIYVTYQLPGTFKQFLSGQTAIQARTDSANATVNYQVYKSNDTAGLTQCGSTVSVATGNVTWQPGIASGAADPSTCGFAANDSIVFKINMTSAQNANAYVTDLGFAFSNF